MIGIESGKVVHFSLLILSYLVIYMSIRQSVSGKLPKLKRLPAVDAIDEVIGRAVEMGKSVVFTHGTSTLESSGSAGSLAAISTLPYVARRCVELDLNLYLPTGSHTAYNVLSEVLRESYIAEGKPENGSGYHLRQAQSPKARRYRNDEGFGRGAAWRAGRMVANCKRF